MRPVQTRPRLLQAMIDAFHLPDLRRRILITFGILVVFRFVAHITLPGVDLTQLKALFAGATSQGALLGMLNMFSGGAMKNFSVAALGVYPYITASIILTLMVPIIPQLQAMSLEGEAGREKIDRITHWLTVPLAGLSGYGQLVFLQRQNAVASAELLPTVAMVFAMIAGTMFCVWLGELITEYGIGNGVSIIIFAGIIAGYWDLIQGMFLAGEQGQWRDLIVYILIALATIVLIIIFTEAHRRIPVQYARAMVRGGRMYKQSGTTYIPLQVNSAGMIPLIFASSLVIFPSLVASYFAKPSGADPNLANHIMNLFNANAPSSPAASSPSLAYLLLL